eukprot:2295472-Rhodomonas_salina.3
MSSSPRSTSRCSIHQPLGTSRSRLTWLCSAGLSECLTPDAERRSRTLFASPRARPASALTPGWCRTRLLVGLFAHRASRGGFQGLGFGGWG